MSDEPKSWPFPKSIDSTKIIAGTVKADTTIPAKPKLYTFMDEDAITLSAYPYDAPEWENNHIRIIEPNVNFIEGTRNILRNVLEQAGITVVME